MRNLFTPKKAFPEDSVDNGGTKEKERDLQKKSVKCCRTKGVYFEKRIKSELALEQELPWHFEHGAAYHCISFGDVDSLTYLRVIVKQQPLEYLLLSTWCMAITDVKELEQWMELGYIRHIDFYVGEIFQGSYADVYLYIKNIAERYNGRVCIFRNHSKVMAGFGRDFDFVIESSANVNTNPRTEQTVITVDTGLADFYKDFFDEINNFSSDFKDWRKYELKRDSNGNL